MENIHMSADALIGATPLIRLTHLEAHFGLNARLLVKTERSNLTGSAKDRAALAMIRRAEESGQLPPGGTIIEPTSGNTGIALAAVGAARGYRVIIVMPDSMSIERRQLIAAYGAQVVLTPGALGMRGAIEKAQALLAEIPGSFLPNQFENEANAQAHFDTTGPEIWADTDGSVDIFVAGIGTGGTVTGAGRYLKARKRDVQIVGVEPAASPLLSEGRAGSHGIQGIGANFVPGILDRAVLDAVHTVTEEQAYAAARLLAAREGILCGISSGAALHCAIALAQQNPGKTVVALLPDTGERYLSTPLWH